MEKILDIKDIKVDFKVDDEFVKAVRGIDMSLYKNEIVTIIGETGCGKSVLGSSVLKLLPDNAYVRGEIYYKGQDILNMNEDEFRKFRVNDISLVPQSPVSSLDPLMKVGEQIKEALDKANFKVENKREYIESLLKRLRLPIERGIYDNYPCELSGGMCQRILIAIGVISRPKLLIVDEPTKGVDWVLRKEIIEIFKELKKDYDSTILMITHDIELAYEISDRVFIMYKGYMLEETDPKNLLENPGHPYTKKLIDAMGINGFKVTKTFSHPTTTVHKNEKLAYDNTFMKEVSNGHYIRYLLESKR